MGFFDEYSDAEQKIDDYLKNHNNISYTTRIYSDDSYNNYPPNNSHQNNMGHFPVAIYVKTSRQTKLLLIIIVVGLAVCIGSAFISACFGDSEMSRTLSKISSNTIEVMSIALGLCVSVGPLIIRFIEKKNCKCKLQATIVDTHTERVKYGRRAYAPIYEYFYEGRVYLVRTDVHRRFFIPKIGSKVDIYINEMNPTDFYVEEKFEITGGLILGVVLVAGALISIF